MRSSYLSSQVRQNAGSAAVAAALLIYFGFFRLVEPAGTDLFSRANWVFYHTLRIGGVAMALVAGGSLIGYTRILLVDALVSTSIGVLLVLTGIAMVMDGGGMMQTMINLLCGGFFASAGIRNWREHTALGHGRDAQTGDAHVARKVRLAPRDDDAPPAPPAASLASRLRQRTVSGDATHSAPVSPSFRPDPGVQLEPPIAPVVQAGSGEVNPPVPDADSALETDTAAPEANPDAPLAGNEQPPETPSEAGGFLASFGKENPPPSP